MLNQKKVEIFLIKIRKATAKQFLEIALNNRLSACLVGFGEKWTLTFQMIPIAVFYKLKVVNI